MAIYLTRLRTPFFINQTSSVTALSADLTITINSVDVYVISKDTVSNEVTFEVSELIRDYLNPTWDGVFPYSTATNNSFVVTATIKVEFYANTKKTRATNAQAGTTDTPISAQTVIILSFKNTFLHLSEYLLPFGKLFSSTLHTIILGFRDKRADLFINSLL